MDCEKAVWLSTALVRTKPVSGPYRARNDWLFCFENCYEYNEKEYSELIICNWTPVDARNELAAKATWMYSVFFAYSVDDQAQVVQGKCCRTWAKYCSTPEARAKTTGAVRCG